MWAKCIFIAISIGNVFAADEDLQFLMKTSTNFLEKYENYLSVLPVQVRIPEDTLLASFKFTAKNEDLSIFGCKPVDVSLYLKYGSIPFVNPDDSKVPEHIKKVHRKEQYELHLVSDSSKYYINISSPAPGFYYVGTFLPYEDPKKKSIKQQGLVRHCVTFIDMDVYIKQARPIDTLVKNMKFPIDVNNKQRAYFKFFVPENISHVDLFIDRLKISENANLTIRLNSNKIPSDNSSILSHSLEDFETGYNFTISAEFSKWFYCEFHVESDDNVTANALFWLEMKYVASVFDESYCMDKLNRNMSEMYKTSTCKTHLDKTSNELVPYREYNLFKISTTENFLYSFILELDVEKENEAEGPTALNLTSEEFTVLKFEIMDTTEIGGTLQFIINAIPKELNSEIIEFGKHTIVGCIRSGSYEIPTDNGTCRHGDSYIPAPIFIREKEINSTVLIPFPEAGEWYATLRLICDKALDCSTSIVVDLSSHPCISGRCGKEGKCLYMISSGVIFSACACFKKYRGMACGDDSNAVSQGTLLLEVLLLTLSNFMFIIAVVVACRRKYFVEALVYFSAGFFSVIYHACDAGDDLYSFCITRLDYLQFGDFFCALFSIWVTLVAMADLSPLGTSICQVGGAIALAFSTTIDRTALWVFLLPTLLGLAIVIVNWGLKYKNFPQRFLEKNYMRINLPIGCCIVAASLSIYTLLQTNENYKYTHSSWHVLIVIALLLFLPMPNTFPTSNFQTAL